MIFSFSQMEISLHRNTPTKHLSILGLFSIKSFTLLKHSSSLQNYLLKCFHVLVDSTLSLCINWVSVHKNKMTFLLFNRFLISEFWHSKTYSHLTFSYFQHSLILFFAIFFSLCKQRHCTYFKLLSSLSLFRYALK